MTYSFTRISDLAQASPTQPTYLAIGVFDGVHRGHQMLLQQMVAQARQDGARAAVLTFFPHPIVLIRGTKGRIYLTPLERRVRLLAEQGLDLIITHPFDDDVRHTRAAVFVDRLRQRLDMRQLWGGSFSLGYQREGNTDYLRQLGSEKGFTVHEVTDLLLLAGKRVSSSRTRQSLSAGDVEDAAACLGRPYRLSGIVTEGQKRGRVIGFPTANLAVWEEQLLPANGVYATYAWINGERYAAATNVGVRPTVDGAHLVVEAHVLDFHGDLYGQEMTLDFMAHIRPEQKFGSLDALVAQIGKDVARVRQLLPQQHLPAETDMMAQLG